MTCQNVCNKNKNKDDCVRGLTGFAVHPETSVSYKPTNITSYSDKIWTPHLASVQKTRTVLQEIRKT